MTIKMSLYVTSICNLTCTECIMKHMMKSDSKYQMSIDEIKKLIEVSEKSNYIFNFVLTGGEPLIWSNLKEGLKLLKQSKITNSITMFSNAMFPEKLDEETLDCIDLIRISHYFYNDAEMAIFQKKWPHKVEVVERTEFWPNPTSPIAEEFALPVHCLNPEVLLYNYNVYACPHALSIAKNNGSTVPLSKPLDFNFLDGMDIIKQGQDKTICTMCVANKMVRNHIESTGKIINISNNKKDIAHFGYDPEKLKKNLTVIKM